MLNEKVRVSHFFHWDKVPMDFVENEMAEFAWNGGKYLTFSSCRRLLEEPSYAADMARLARRYGLEFADVHGAYGGNFDLDLESPLRRESLIRDHAFFMEKLAELGMKTYTVHIGALPWCRTPVGLDLPQIRSLALETLEKLLPFAEKTGMILCVENSFEPVDTPEELLYYVDHFRSPCLQMCFDAGHANIMRASGKESSKYDESFHSIVWRGNLVLDDRIPDRMLPHIVTCHLHDNDGYHDQHNLPGSGTGDWDSVMKKLEQAPLLQSIQNETDLSGYHISIGKAVKAFRILAGPEMCKNDLLKHL